MPHSAPFSVQPLVTSPWVAAAHPSRVASSLSPRPGKTCCLVISPERTRDSLPPSTSSFRSAFSGCICISVIKSHANVKFSARRSCASCPGVHLPWRPLALAPTCPGARLPWRPAQAGCPAALPGPQGGHGPLGDPCPSSRVAVLFLTNLGVCGRFSFTSVGLFWERRACIPLLSCSPSPPRVCLMAALLRPVSLLSSGLTLTLPRRPSAEPPLLRPPRRGGLLR